MSDGHLSPEPDEPDPADPSDPSDPSGPGDPADPADPDPIDPTDPCDPDPCEPRARMRADVWRLDDWDETLLWYARAIAEMQTRSIADPTSWRYQAAIHAYSRAGDPYADEADELPSSADQLRFWNQCQHSSWYFLPWHRMYLGTFEQIVAATVEQLGGPTGWSLPYWNYSDDSNPDARRLPPAFRATTTPDGDPNPLRVEQRVSGANAGDVIATSTDVDIVDCLDETIFLGTAFGGTTGFGGPETAFNHGGGPPGKLEMTPHGDIHMAVGGFSPGGFMSRFNTAGLDPLFWLHHANIDRLWTVWLKRRPTNVNPTQTQWLSSPSFELHDASGAVVAMTSSEVVDSETSVFAYRYQDETDPLTAPVVEPVETVEVTATEAASGEEEWAAMEQSPAELVGATESGTTLRGEPVTASVELVAATLPPTPEAVEGEAAPERIHLNIENIRGSEPVPHLVYLNLPEGADPAEHSERLAGSLSMFGLAEASGQDPEHPGSGLQYSLDITRVVEVLGDDWSPDELRVTLVPKSGGAAPAEAVEEAAPSTIHIGRISVYRGH